MFHSTQGVLHIILYDSILLCQSLWELHKKSGYERLGVNHSVPGGYGFFVCSADGGEKSLFSPDVKKTGGNFLFGFRN